MRLSTCAVLASAMLAAPVHAASLDPLSILQDYNAVALGDFTMQSSHVEGTMFVGGTLHSNNDTDMNGDGQSSSSGAALTVGGNVTGGQMRVLNGDAEIGGSANGRVRMNGGGTLTEGATVDVTSVASALRGLSSYLATLSDTPGVAYDSTRRNVPLTLGEGDADGYAVLNLDAAQGALFLAGNLNALKTDGYAGVFLNIAGTTLTHTGNWNAGGGNVILNLFEAETFNHTNGNLNFSVLAPGADVLNAGSGMNGFLVGETIVNRAEIRPPLHGRSPVNFDGSLPNMPQIETASQVPLPAAGVLLLGGLGGLALLGRRRRENGAKGIARG